MRLAIFALALMAAMPAAAQKMEVIHSERLLAPLSRHCNSDTWALVYFPPNHSKPPDFPNGGWIVEMQVFVNGKIELEHLATFALFDRAVAFMRQAHASTHGDETNCPHP